MSKNNGKPKKPDGRMISKKLNLRQRRFVAEFTNPEGEAFGNATKSAEASGYSLRRAMQTGHDLVRNREIVREVDRVMDELGATVQHGITRLKEGMDAKEVKVFHTKSGEIIYSKPLVALQERRLATEQMFRLRGLFPTNREQDRISGLIFQQNILVVPAVMPSEDRRKKPVRQLED